MAAALRSLYVYVVFSVSLISLALAQGENYFIFHGLSDSNLHLDGVAEIQPSGLLQLTDSYYTPKMAHAFYPFPFRFNTSSSQSLSFSTNFVFAMDSLNYRPGLGRGVAFVISPSMDFSKAFPGAYLGLFNYSNNGLSTNHILAVKFGSALSPEFFDIEDNQVGIYINSLISNQSASASYFSDEEGIYKDMSLEGTGPIQIWIDYNAAEMLLNVTLAPIKVPKPSKLLLSKPLDPSQILLDSMYVGFSASTDPDGILSYILGWSFNRTGQAQNLDISKLPPMPPSSSSLDNGNAHVSTIFFFLIPMLGALIAISGSVYL
ncbi:putative L-type lectin-domain containing receptor kinase II.2 [Pistacia vera]|uniref:putative L-type lectin-domain containing receptor kinase II.2 n=1 Tax=Pistacia vera TaxID=55513 RepID=UPI0012638007|nr:putative L-type lectin-domain containing receptor kinase II.2 [Pistacia vera]